MKKTIFSLLTLLLCSTSLFSQTNLVTNGDFTQGTEGWTITFQTPSDSNNYIIAAADQALIITQSGSANNRVDITQDITIEPNTQYTLSFQYAEPYKKLRLWSYFVSENGKSIYLNDTTTKDPLRTYNSYLQFTDVLLPMSYTFTTPNMDTVTTFKLQFRVYKQQGNVARIKSVSLIKDIPTNLTNTQNNNTQQSKKYLYRNKQTILIQQDNSIFDCSGHKIQ